MALFLISTSLPIDREFTTKTFKIIEIKPNYLVVQDNWLRKYYLSSKKLTLNDEYCLNRYLSISGNLQDLEFSAKPYSFNFGDYLAKQAINYEIAPIQLTILNKGWLYKINRFYLQAFSNPCQQIFLFGNHQKSFMLVKSLNNLSLQHLLNFSGLTIFLWDFLISKFAKHCHLSFRATCGLKEVLGICLLVYSFTLRLPFVLTKTIIFLLVKNFYWLKQVKIDKYNLWMISFAILLAFHLEIMFSTTMIYYVVGLLFFQKPSIKAFWKILGFDYVITTLTFGLLEAAFDYQFHYFNAFFVSFLTPQISLLALFVDLTFWIPKIGIVYQFLMTQIINQNACFSKINFYYSVGKISSFYYLFIFCGLLILRNFWSKSWEIGLCFIITSSLIIGLFIYKYVIRPYGFHILDVGNGLTTIYLDKTTTLIFDAGVGSGHNKQQLSDFCRFYGIDRIDGLFISHAHSDHYNEFENLVASGVKLKMVVHKENALENYHLNDLQLHLFNRQQHHRNENNNSLVIFLSSKLGNFLLPGDLEHKGEQMLLDNQRFLILLKQRPIDCLIVGHHGSKTSSSSEWLKMLHPKFAIISGEIKGFNRFPNIETINELKAQKIPYFVTSEKGDIWIK